jgi:hypothetical protein
MFSLPVHLHSGRVVRLQDAPSRRKSGGEVMKTALREAVAQVTDKRSMTALPSGRSPFVKLDRDGIVFDVQVAPSTRLVWIGLCSFANADGICWPSADAIGKRMGISERQVWRALHDLARRHNLQDLGLSNVGTNKYQLIGFQTERQTSFTVEDSVSMPNYDMMSYLPTTEVCHGVIRTISSSDLEEKEKEKRGDLSDKSDQPALLPTASKIMRTVTSETTYSSVQELWNSVCGAAGMPKINKLDGKRKAAVNRLLRDYTLDQLSDLFHQAAASDFLAGRRPSKGHANWRATFDWLCTEHVLLKLSEGDYNNEPGVYSPRAATVAAVSCPQTGTHMNPDDKWQAEQERLLQKPRGGIARHMESSPASDFDGAEDHLHLEQLRPGIHSHLFGPLTDTRQLDVTP